MKDRQSPSPSSSSSIQEPLLEEEQLHSVLESPINEETPVETPSTGSQSCTQELPLEEESVLESPANEDNLAEAPSTGSQSCTQEPPLEEESGLESPTNEDNSAETPSTVETQDVSQQTVETGYDIEAEIAYDMLAARREFGANVRRAVRRVQRSSRACPQHLSPFIVFLLQNVGLNDRQIWLCRDNRAALNHVKAYFNRLGNLRN